MHYYYPDDDDYYYDCMRQQQITEYRRQEMMRQRASALERERHSRLKQAIETERRRRIWLAHEQQRLMEEQQEQERKELEYAKKLYEHQQRGRNTCRQPSRETIVRGGRDGRIYRYANINDDADDGSFEKFGEYVHVVPPRENIPVVSIPARQVTSSPADAVHIHMGVETKTTSSKDDGMAMEITTAKESSPVTSSSTDKDNGIIIEYASDDEDDIQSKENASLVPNSDMGESWMEPITL